MLLGQYAITDMDSTASVFYKCQDNIFGQVESQGCLQGNLTLNTNNTVGALPGLSERVSGDQSSIWTDIFDSIKTWFLTQTGLGWLFQLAAAPVTFLNAIQLPGVLVFAISALWYLYI